MNMHHNPVVFLRFLGSACVSKVSAREDLGGDLDNDAFLLTTQDSPLKWLMTNRHSSSTVYYLLLRVGFGTRGKNGNSIVFFAS